MRFHDYLSADAQGVGLILPGHYATERPAVEDLAGRLQTEFPDLTVWLVLKRTLGAAPSYAYAISNAPASTPLSTFVWLSGLRWAVEQCFEEGKTELGMDHYEVRKYPGWHHHMLTTMLAHFFLWHLKLRLGKKSAGPHRIAATHDIGSGLTPAHVYDCRCFGVSGVGPKAQSPGLLVPPKTVARGWLRAWETHGMIPRYFL